MKITQENIDPSKMSADEFRSVVDKQPLVYAYAQKTVVEATLAVEQAGAPADPADRTDRIYDKIDDLLQERLQDSTLAKSVMAEAGVYGEMYERYERMSWEKEDRKLLDSISSKNNIPLERLARFEAGAIAVHLDGKIDYVVLDKETVKFQSDNEFTKWAADQGVPNASVHKALETVVNNLPKMNAEVQRSAKEQGERLDTLSKNFDVPRAELVPLNFETSYGDGAVFRGDEGQLTFVALGTMPIRFRADGDFINWAAETGARRNQTLAALELQNTTPVRPETPIGSMMPRADWEHARAEVSKPGQPPGKVFLPKTGHDYAGRIMFMTDTHLVQRVGQNAAVIHDLSKLENGQDLAKAFDKREIGPKSNLHVRYGQEQGVAEIVPFNVGIAREMREKVMTWAQAKIPNDRTRATFSKHFDAFTQDLIKGYTPQQAKPSIAARAPERAPQLERRH